MMRAVLMTPAHLRAVAELEQLVFEEPWSERSLALLCGEGGFGTVLLDDRGNALAYGGMMTVLDEGQITNIATHPDYRRRGYAACVLQALLSGARARALRTLSLEVRESNTAAIVLYTRFGFEIVGKRNHFYTAPREDALVMVCDL
ncbi:MAG: ribosomal protein S18-alanine N-acetyltransferase [Clostridia bacterium]|nr:ribosomal protein S18-alanine N-acetyltransferase [Clostridia bacterium]